jgi:hypothetical protein
LLSWLAIMANWVRVVRAVVGIEDILSGVSLVDGSTVDGVG